MSFTAYFRPGCANHAGNLQCKFGGSPESSFKERPEHRDPLFYFWLTPEGLHCFNTLFFYL